jgi:hypothetical protein
MVVAACAQSPSGEFEQIGDDSTLADGAVVAQEANSGADEDTEGERLDGGGAIGEGAGSEAPPTSGAVRDAAKPPATTPATVRNDASTDTKPSTGTATRPPTTGTSDAAAATPSGGDAGAKPSDPGTVKPSEPSPRDAGTPATPSTPSAGATCAAAAGYATSDACSQCICAKCATQVTACYASSDPAKNTQCGQVQDCAEKNHCTSSGCYCGDAILCLGTPSGACVSVIETVAGTQDSLEILRASNDSESAVGRANEIGLCSQQSCTRECGL